jgi:DNA modification methylase
MNLIEFGDCRETMRRWAEQGVKAQMCVTSPPYFGLRDYGTGTWEGGDPTCSHTPSGLSADAKNVRAAAPNGKPSARDAAIIRGECPCGAVRVDRQIGLEQTPEQYIAAMVEVFRAVRDVLADDGTLWLNIGDSYANDGKWGGSSGGKHAKALHGNTSIGRTKVTTGLKPKDLIGIPWMLAFALRADGWYLRSDLVWAKGNPMPESVMDRPTRSHEYIFLLTKRERYFYDHEAVKEPAVSDRPSGNGFKRDARQSFQNADGTARGNEMQGKDVGGKRNRRSVWHVNAKPYKGAHFATFPPALIEPCILAGSRPGDIVLDPFMGSGTTAAVALRHGRQYLGCELNAEYGALQAERINEAMEAAAGAAAQPDLFEGAA